MPERSSGDTRSFIGSLGLSASTTERRITKTGDNAKLKSLAGIITSLTYSEMTEFAGKLNIKINNGTQEIPEILLEIADDILKEK